MNPYYKPPAVLIDELGITEPSEIKIEAIAKHCGATIVYETLDGCEARILGRDDSAIITVNSRSSRQRQRFSAGHELGHWMRDRGRVAFACTEPNLNRDWDEDVDSPERRANRYAADLLLPRKLFTKHVRSAEPTFAYTRELAASFQTSLTATAIRLVELGPSPAMVIGNEASGRKWFFAAEVVPKALWPRRRPGDSTNAAKLLTGIASELEPKLVDANEWIDHRDAERYTLKEDSIVIYPGFVLTLLWWQNEAQILALAREDGDEPNALTGELRFSKR